MAKVKVTYDAGKALLDFKKRIKKVTNDRRLTKDWGEFLTTRVRFEARKGKPLNKDRSFPELSDASKKIRRGLAKENPTHPSYRAGKSNLTFSGQLIEAVSFESLKNGKFKLFVRDSSRKLIVGGDNTMSNSEIDKKLRKGVTSRQFGTRKFVLFDAAGLKSDKKIPKRLKQILLRFLRRQLRRG